jgi:hypothetical protein
MLKWAWPVPPRPRIRFAMTSLRRLPLITLCGILALARAFGAELEIGFPDGHSETVAIAQIKGVDYLSLQSLGGLLSYADAGATLEHEYSPASLRIVAAGKSVSVTEVWVVIEGRISRPEHPLLVAGGEFFVPVETIREINGVAQWFSIPEPPPPPEPEQVRQIQAILPPEKPLPFTNEIAIDRGAAQRPPLAMWDAAPAPPPEPLDPIERDAPPIMIPGIVRSISPDELATLLSRAPLASVSSIAVAAIGGDAAIHGPYAEAVGAATGRMAARLAKDLTDTGRFSVHSAPAPFNPVDQAAIVEWANESKCDILVALTADVASKANVSGMRILTAHSAGDPAASPLRDAEAYGLPLAFNYVPYQDYSLLLANMIYGETAWGLGMNVRAAEVAPLYLLRRCAMPSVMISLGYATNRDDLAQMLDDSFAASVSGAAAKALMHFQTKNRGF